MHFFLLILSGQIGWILGLATIHQKEHKRSFDYEDGDLSEENRQPRIIGGQPIGRGAIQHQLHFSYKGEIECGATLVEVYAVQIAITASHCLWLGYPNLDSFMEPQHLHVTAGDRKLSVPDFWQEEQSVTKVVAYPSYDPKYYTHDISILFLKGPFNESAWVEPITLPGHDWKIGEDIRVSGWGSEILWQDLQDELMWAIIYPVPQATCLGYNNIPALNVHITENQFCAGSRNSEHVGTCSGDSGGPAVAYNITEGVYYLTGVTSFGISYVCGNPFYPTVFTRVQNYVDWIRIEVSKYIEEGGGR